MPNHMQPSIVSRKRNRSSSPPDSRPCRPPPKSTRLANETNYDDTWSKIGRLEYELRSLRGQIDASLCRETSIVLELQALGHSAPPRETPQEIALREKLQKLEAQLQAETRMRIEAETALKDFQMECKEPFLVPALYDVVESISRLTTQVVGGIQQEVGERGL
ncbi:hypothetical protein J132_06727 [Termitomyces sp. J132]|nr:hypothetical protein J132_06727 [Termitomyces sp. J132]